MLACRSVLAVVAAMVCVLVLSPGCERGRQDEPVKPDSHPPANSSTGTDNTEVEEAVTITPEDHLIAYEGRRVEICGVARPGKADVPLVGPCGGHVFGIDYDESIRLSGKTLRVVGTAEVYVMAEPGSEFARTCQTFTGTWVWVNAEEWEEIDPADCQAEPDPERPEGREGTRVSLADDFAAIEGHLVEACGIVELLDYGLLICDDQGNRVRVVNVHHEDKQSAEGKRICVTGIAWVPNDPNGTYWRESALPTILAENWEVVVPGSTPEGVGKN